MNKNKNSINTTEAFSLTLNQSSRHLSYRSNLKIQNVTIALIYMYEDSTLERNLFTAGTVKMYIYS